MKRWLIPWGAFWFALGYAATAYAQEMSDGPEQVFQMVPPEMRAVAFIVSGIGLGLFVVVSLAVKFVVQPAAEGGGMERIEARLSNLEGRFDRVDDRFNGMDGRFSGIERDLRRLTDLWRNGKGPSTHGA